MRIIFLSFFFLSSLLARELITPIPFSIDYDKPKALLGKKLFFDTRLSKDDTISCAHCHNLEEGGDDGLQFSIGINGQEGTVNSPTVLNSFFNIAQFWDGRAKDLQEQALMPIHNPIEMGMEEGEVVEKLNSIREYRSKFFDIYEDGITLENITDAIAEFEKALITPNSRFDQYLRGAQTVLDKDEKEGYRLFKELGCISCHNGILLGGNFYQKIGVFEDYDTGQNLGRYNVTKKEEDKYYFKVPTLRNVAKTAPYFHDGSVLTLKESIQIMAFYQLGREIEKEKRDLILKFLKTLDGQKPEILNEK